MPTYWLGFQVCIITTKQVGFSEVTNLIIMNAKPVTIELKGIWLALTSMKYEHNTLRLWLRPCSVRLEEDLFLGLGLVRIPPSAVGPQILLPKSSGVGGTKVILTYKQPDYSRHHPDQKQRNKQAIVLKRNMKDDSRVRALTALPESLCVVPITDFRSSRTYLFASGLFLRFIYLLLIMHRVIYLHTRRGHQISLWMAMSHQVLVGN